jgi:hypothetical protein
MFALSVCLVLAVPVATLSLAFKLLPGRLPAGTPKFEFQRTVLFIAQVNRGRNAHDARIHLHPSLRLRMEYSLADLDKPRIYTDAADSLNSYNNGVSHDFTP